RRLQANQNQSIRQLQRRWYGRLQPPRVQRGPPVGVRFSQWLQNDAVDNRLDRMILALLQAHPLFDLGDLTVDADAVTLLIERLELLAKLALAPTHDWRQHRDALTRRLRLVALHNLRHDLIRALPRDRPVAVRAVRLAHACPQQAEVIVNLRNRSDCG